MVLRPAFTLEQARTFLAVAAHEHMTRAAEEIHLSQGAVTQQIQILERTLGFPLFERVGRGVRLTDAGAALAPACRALIRAAEVVVETADSLRSIESGSVLVGASQTAVAHYLPAVLVDFLELHPGVDISVAPGNTTDISRRVAEGGLDCGIVEGQTAERTLVQRPLAEDEVLLVTAPGHPLVERRRLRLHDLDGALYLAREPGSGTEALAAERLGPIYTRLRRIQLGQLDAVKAAAVAGLGLAVLPRLSIAPELESGRLVRLPVPPWPRTIQAIRRSGAGGPALEAFWARLIRPAPSATGQRG